MPLREPPPPPKAAPRRVLLIEDNRDAREIYRMMLELEGHLVLEAGEGQSGLELLKTEIPDVAVIDLGLPGLDGYQIASRFRREPTGHRVLLVAVTGHAAPEARERSLAAGFDHHLVKPVDPDVLRGLLLPGPPSAPSGAPPASQPTVV